MWPRPCNSNTRNTITETLLWTVSGIMILLDLALPQL